MPRLGTKSLSDAEVIAVVNASAIAPTSILSAGVIEALSLAADHLQFPATQVPSADANAIDDAEEGLWTPDLTFSTPGNLVTVFGTALGWYTKIGRLVIVHFHLKSTTFTHTTASGNCFITGLPFTSLSTTFMDANGVFGWAGITVANYTQINLRINPNTTKFDLRINGSAQGVGGVTAAEMPTTGTLDFEGTCSYLVA